MKILLSLLLVIGVFTASAQTLKFKAGQKFSYEGINSSDTKTQNISYENYMYWKTNFQVISQKNATYVVKAFPQIILASWDDRIHDSSVPFDELPKEFFAVVRKTLTESSYIFTLNDKGDISDLQGLEKIKTVVVAKAKELGIPEFNQSYRELADVILSEKYLKTLTSFFKGTGQRSETTGLINYFVLDTTETSVSAEGVEESRTRTTNKFNLLTIGSQLVKGSFDLLTEAKIAFNYDDYYTPINKARHKINELADRYNFMKGNPSDVERIVRELDSVDRSFDDHDYEYLEAKLGFLMFLGGKNYNAILQRVPYNYLSKSVYIDAKIGIDLQNGNLDNIREAVKLRFTKFKGENLYPKNIEYTKDFTHRDFGRLISRMNNRDSLTRVFNLLQQIEGLNIPIVTEMYKGMKTYVEAKLATDQNELSRIADIQFSSLFDKAGRYRLLIYDELVTKKAPDSIRSAYIDYTIDLNQKKIEMINSGKIEHITPLNLKDLRDNLMVNKKNLADAYYRKSQLHKNTQLSYLQIAAEYLPSQQDLVDNSSALTEEYEFTPYINYTDLYLVAAGDTGVSEEAKLSKYVDMVIIEPERYGLLKEKYIKAFPNGDFKAFFNNALKTKLPAVPNFSLTERLGAVVSNRSLPGKFVFVDFWGTWCGSCVSEIHKIEEMHLNNPFPERLLVTTIACFNKKKDVDDFMVRKNYSYPVLISDGKVENDFKVGSYPTKLLLLPNGVYLTIPRLNDYNNIVSKYLKWEI